MNRQRKRRCRSVPSCVRIENSDRDIACSRGNAQCALKLGGGDKHRNDIDTTRLQLRGWDKSGALNNQSEAVA
jgi:hypothetical protein